MKDVELMLVSELMKNCRRSDRDLAGVLGVSQPTVSRILKALKSEGFIPEYATIPDFHKLGFELMSINFIKFRAGANSKDLERMRETANQMREENRLPTLLVMNGMGMGFERVLIMFHKDYSSYSKFVDISESKALGNLEKFESFLVSLRDETHYQPLSLSTLARFLLATGSGENSQAE